MCIAHAIDKAGIFSKLLTGYFIQWQLKKRKIFEKIPTVSETSLTWRKISILCEREKSFTWKHVLYRLTREPALVNVLSHVVVLVKYALSPVLVNDARACVFRSFFIVGYRWNEGSSKCYTYFPGQRRVLKFRTIPLPGSTPSVTLIRYRRKANMCPGGNE